MLTNNKKNNAVTKQELEWGMKLGDFRKKLRAEETEKELAQANKKIVYLLEKIETLRSEINERSSYDGAIVGNERIILRYNPKKGYIRLFVKNPDGSKHVQKINSDINHRSLLSKFLNDSFNFESQEGFDEKQSFDDEDGEDGEDDDLMED